MDRLRSGRAASSSYYHYFSSSSYHYDYDYYYYYYYYYLEKVSLLRGLRCPTHIEPLTYRAPYRGLHSGVPYKRT